jgi:hypothetical protein
MWTFVLSGSLYLAGIAVILLVRPSTMFAPDGSWKEFGIGKRQDKYTPFPFWLFCLVWALVSYGFVLSVQALMGTLPTVKTPKANVFSTMTYVEEEVPKPQSLPKGYYVLNKKASKLSGTPKYIYLGESPPAGFNKSLE